MPCSLGVDVAVGLVRLDLLGDTLSMSLLNADQLHAVSLSFSGIRSHQNST
jgi:hypothetical protein